MFAFGQIDDIKDAFADNIRGPVERPPVGPKDLGYEHSAIVTLMLESPDALHGGGRQSPHAPPRTLEA